jgi:hypothetical protein
VYFIIVNARAWEVLQNKIIIVMWGYEKMDEVKDDERLSIEEAKDYYQSLK